MKKYLCFCMLLFSFSSFAQFHLSILNNDVTNALEKVIEDFPNHFNIIRGDVIDKDVQTVNYSCTVNIPGADSSIIIQNGELKDNIYSWKEVVFESNDFDKAKTKFHAYYKDIKGTAVTIDNSRISFNADYNEPDNVKQFTTILFIAHPQITQLKNVVIDLSLHYLMDSWQISICIYEHTDYGVEDNE